MRALRVMRPQTGKDCYLRCPILSNVCNSSVSPGRLPLMRVLRVMRPRTGKSNGRPEDPWKLTLMLVLRVMRQRTGKL